MSFFILLGLFLTILNLIISGEALIHLFGLPNLPFSSPFLHLPAPPSPKFTLDRPKNDNNSEYSNLRYLALRDPTLTELNISGNGIGDTLAKAIAHTLSFDSFLTSLNLSGNKIKNKEAVILAQALTSNSTCNLIK